MKNEGQFKRNIPTSIVIGLIIGAVLSLTGMLFVTFMITNEKIAMNNIGIAVMILTGLAVITGSFCAVIVSKSNVLLVSLSTGAALLLICLSMTAVFFEGQYTGVPVTTALIIGCSFASALLSTKFLNAPKRYHKKR